MMGLKLVTLLLVFFLFSCCWCSPVCDTFPFELTHLNQYHKSAPMHIGVDSNGRWRRREAEIKIEIDFCKDFFNVSFGFRFWRYAAFEWLCVYVNFYRKRSRARCTTLTRAVVFFFVPFFVNIFDHWMQVIYLDIARSNQSRLHLSFSWSGMRCAPLF